MKRIAPMYLLVFLLVYGCKEQQQENTKINSGSSVVEEEQMDVTDELYSLNGTCEDFIRRLDFSSFCFSENKTPKYRLVQNNETNCQFELYDLNNYQNIHLTIAFADFYKPMGNEVQPELRKNIFMKLFEKNKRQRMLPAEAIEISNLGDDAYIGYNQSQSHKEQYLGVRKGNVSFTFVFEHGKTKANQSCVSSKEDIVKIGKLVLASL